MALVNITYTEVLYNAPYVAAEVLAGETKDVTSTSADVSFVNSPTGPTVVTIAAMDDVFVSIAPSANAGDDAKRRLVLGGVPTTLLVPGGQQVKARLA
ncbi:MAG: hypothetical protein AB1698_01545 [Pseudomonadota bacterium]